MAREKESEIIKAQPMTIGQSIVIGVVGEFHRLPLKAREKIFKALTYTACIVCIVFFFVAAPIAIWFLVRKWWFKA